MHLGYLTAHELASHKAMCQISAMEWKTETRKTLQAKNLEQIVDFFRGRRQLFEQIEEMAVRGQAPWTMHAFQTHTPILSAWTYRTQKLIPWETLSGRASFCTYASNAFFSKLAKPDERQLGPIEPGIAGCEVVADIALLLPFTSWGCSKKPLSTLELYIYLQPTARLSNLMKETSTTSTIENRAIASTVRHDGSRSTSSSK